MMPWPAGSDALTSPGTRHRADRNHSQVFWEKSDSDLTSGTWLEWRGKNWGFRRGASGKQDLSGEGEEDGFLGVSLAKSGKDRNADAARWAIAR